MKISSERRLEIVTLILLIIGIVASLPLMELRAEEPRRAIITLEMMRSGEWIVPKLHNWFYYNKPPFYNWILAAFFYIFNSYNEVVVRLPGVLSHFITAFLVYRLVGKYYEKRIAIIAGLLQLAAADILFYGAVDSGEIDLFFMLLSFIQMLLLFNYSTKQSWLKMFVFTYFVAALGVLTKGLPSILFQGIGLLVWLTYLKQFKKLFTLQHLAGVVVFAAIVGGYFYVYSTRNDVVRFLTQMVKESTQQSVTESALAPTIQNVLQSPIQLLYITLPASLLIFYVFNKRVRNVVSQQPLFMFALLFVLFNIPFYLITRRTPNRYLYPFFPFIIIIASIIYANALNGVAIKRVVKYKTVIIVLLIFGVLRNLYSFIGVPYQMRTSDELIYRKLCTDLVTLSKGNTVYLSGPPVQYISNPSLPGFTIEADTFYIPPIVPYQIPYYCAKYSGGLMLYDSLPVKGRYYICEEDFAKQRNATVYKRFEEIWWHKKMVLATF